MFGSKCTVFLDPGKKSLKKRAHEGAIVAKYVSTKGFKVYLPSENKVIATRHIQDICTLYENAKPKKLSDQAPIMTESAKAFSAPRRSRRLRQKTRQLAEDDGDVSTSESRNLRGPVALTFSEANEIYQHADDPEPKILRQARKCAESALWEKAEQEELAALKANNTWKLVKCEPGAVRLHSK